MAKNDLEKQTSSQVDPYYVKGSDFSVKKVSAGHGQSSDASGEKDSLAKLSHNQESPRDVEDADYEGSGSKENEEDSMADRARSVASNFKVGKGSNDAKSVSIPESVDLGSGDIEVSGYKKTAVKEVAEKHVSIG